MLIPINLTIQDNQAKPIIEFRQRFERRIDKQFSSAVDDQLAVPAFRLRYGFEFGPSKDVNFRIVMQSEREWTVVPGKESQDDRNDAFEFSVAKKLGDSWITLGRQIINKGDKRLVANSDWSNVGRTFDGVRFTNGRWDGFIGRLGAAQRANRENKMAFLSYTSPFGETSIINKLDGMASPVTSIQTIDHVWTRKIRNLDLYVEGMVQMGKSGGKNVDAFAGVAKGALRIDPKWQIIAEADIASGGDSKDKTRKFDSLYASAFAPYGIMDTTGLRDMKMLSIGAIWDPMKTVNVKFEYLKFWLYDNTDGWYDTQNTINVRPGGSFVDATGAKGGDLGGEFNVNATWKYAKNQSLSGGIGVFQPGSFIKAFNGNDTSNQIWGYVMWTVKG